MLLYYIHGPPVVSILGHEGGAGVSAAASLGGDGRGAQARPPPPPRSTLLCFPKCGMGGAGLDTKSSPI